MAKANGAVVYHGPSLIDGEEIVVIATGLNRGSRNTKTGEMIQTWILLADIAPHRAAKNGADYSICGDCALRFNPETNTRLCYVRVHDAPLSIWRAWNRGSYPVIAGDQLADLAAGHLIRLGAYGDPAAVPAKIWQQLVANASGWTGYTHQWASLDPVVSRNAEQIREFCMASVEDLDSARQAWQAGWRTFRTVADADHRIRQQESACPADRALGAKLTCTECRGCSGIQGVGRASRVITWHGASAAKLAA